MHLLAAQPGTITDGAEAVDLGQTPGDIVFLSAADSELASLAAQHAILTKENPDRPSLRLASLLHLGHNMSVDLHCEAVIAHARLVVVRLLGGRGYWPYGADQVAALCRRQGIRLAFVPGDDQPDPELAELSTLPADAQHRLWQYCVHGGPDNARNFLNFAADLIGRTADWIEPRPLVPAGLYWPAATAPDLDAVRAHWRDDLPTAAVVFYRALVQAANTVVVDALIEGLQDAALNPLPLFVTSLKDPVSAATVENLLAEAPADVVLNATGFAVSGPGRPWRPSPLDGTDGGGPVVLQVVFSGGNEEAWRETTRGLSARDIAMNVALPEVDGRLLSRAVSFKGLSRRDSLTETDIVHYEPLADRIAFVCRLAAGWVKLRRKAAGERRVAVVLANYPNRDGRIGNGVGLDTPAGVVRALGALEEGGFAVGPIPESGDALIAKLAVGPTNAEADPASRDISETLSMADYQVFFGGLPRRVRDAVTARWGAPEADPFHIAGEVDCGRFAIPAFRLGNVAIGLQPARGYHIDPQASYHDPDLVPPHGSSPSTPGSGAPSRPTPSSTSASTATSNGCPARRWRCRRRATRKRRWGRCPTSIRSSSTTPARAPKPSGGPPPSSSTT